jgi:hypothetical protein
MSRGEQAIHTSNVRLPLLIVALALAATIPVCWDMAGDVVHTPAERNLHLDSRRRGFSRWSLPGVRLCRSRLLDQYELDDWDVFDVACELGRVCDHL